ncbi:ATP-dependent Clp protease ATP-binding subunit [Pseudalkalibacillus hwajinpoensis]|uniref:ATP-dependent Clp protease ATP-binding subunit n=1 Tax=Guptibacillus hwajinpoensis TaxID=208199 RepID=UPI001CD3364A|nr:ATP-dependent Clp protease ATP-binding subunit [Pseudalkalibacillus hwajinpoensis]MCA0993285.1 ATP-dependent Clp protease ATP-binding subunit [Pseudalkalibacillus hwajinpoensis]
MLCDQCQQNQASVQLNVQMNQHKKRVNLCSTCYANVMNGQTASSPKGQMDDFFQSFMASAEQNGFTSQEDGPQTKSGKGKGGLLDNLGRNLSDAAKAGLIDPVIGRENEVARVIETLNRRNKNNPVLIGEAGVGKTAIAEGLALRISEGQVPSKLKNKEIYLLDVASLVSNTGVRGQFEERMKQLISELQSRKNVILFIDELHQIVGAGSAEGSMDAGNILKPALARGELQLIGATTLKEYRQIEKDAALERRFQPVMVNEPTVEEAIEILKGLQPKYEEYHEVKYTDEAIQACVSLSNRFIQDRFLPDKAIDLMDEAGAKMNLTFAVSNHDEIQERLQQIATEKNKAAEAEDYELAAKLRTEELQLEKQLEETLKSNSNMNHSVDLEEIQQIVEGKTGIPVRKLREDEQTKMKNLAERLNAKVIGQEDAVNKVAKAIRRSRAGLKRQNRPIGSFLFVGPTGVGKTELSRSLAEEMFGDREAMIRLDMSEYMEKHSVSKLIGSPPGYVGHEEAGQLTERVRRKPYSIILIDEVEKAHPDVQNMFLQILDDGRLTDSQGRTVSFKDTVIIMTSNAGTSERRITVGFESAESYTGVMESLGGYFRPEFLNRFDGIIPFKSLEQSSLVTIVDLMINDLDESLEEQNITLTISEAAKEKLAVLGYNPQFGARPLRRVIEEHVEDGIADLLVDEGSIKSVTVEIVEDKIVVSQKK